MFLLKFIFRKHIFTASCAATWTYSLTHKQTTEYNQFLYLYLLLVFITVLLAYNYQYINKLNKPITLYILTGIILLLVGAYYPIKKIPIVKDIVSFNFLYSILAFCILCTLSYKVFLRNVPYIKATVIAMCWTLVCAVIPHLLIYDSINIFVFTEVFLIALCICVLFDLKHINYDTGKIKTLATLLGSIYTKLICVLILSAAGYIGFLHSTTNYTVLFYLFAALIIINSEKIKNIYLYQFAFDGLILIHGTLMLI